MLSLAALSNPLALFPLDNDIEVRDISFTRLSPGRAFGVHLVESSNQNVKSSLYFNGTTSSFVIIANISKLLIGDSFTILLWVYPQGEHGHLFYYGNESSGIQLWLKEGVLTLVLLQHANHKFTISGLDVLLNEWNLVGASYDFQTGVARLWSFHKSHNKTSLEKKVGFIQTESHPSLLLAVSPYRNLSFLGRLACLQVYEGVLPQEDIKNFQDRCSKKKGKTR